MSSTRKGRQGLNGWLCRRDSATLLLRSRTLPLWSDWYFGPAIVGPIGNVASEEAVGIPLVADASVLAVGPIGDIGTEEAVPDPTVVAGEVFIAPDGIASAEAVGTPGKINRAMYPAAIASLEAFGTAAVTVGPLYVAPKGINASSFDQNNEDLGRGVFASHRFATANDDQGRAWTLVAGTTVNDTATLPPTPDLGPWAKLNGSTTTRLEVTDATLAIGVGPCTYEFYYRTPTTIGVTSPPLMDCRAGNATNGFYPYIGFNLGALGFYWNGAYRIQGAVGTVGADTPCHVALTRDEFDVWRLFLNGQQQGADYTEASAIANTRIRLGNNAATSPTVAIASHFADFRALDQCLYTADFTPPAVPRSIRSDLGTFTIKLYVLPTSIASTAAFGTPTIIGGVPAIVASGIPSLEAFGTPALTPGATSVVPAAVASAESFGTPAIGVYVLPTSITTAAAVGAPTVTPGTATIAPAGIASANAVGTPTLAPGATTVVPSSIASAEALGTATVVPGNVGIVPGGIGTTEALGAVVVEPGAVAIEPAGIATAAAVGTPSVSVGTVTIAPDTIASLEALGTPALTAEATIAPAGIPTELVFGSARVASVTYVEPIGIATAEAVGVPELVPGVAAIIAQAIASATAFGEPTLVPGVVAIAPGSITSLEGVPAPQVTFSFLQELFAGSIASAELFGAAYIVTPVIGLVHRARRPHESIDTAQRDAAEVDTTPRPEDADAPAPRPEQDEAVGQRPRDGVHVVEV